MTVLLLVGCLGMACPFGASNQDMRDIKQCQDVGDSWVRFSGPDARYSYRCMTIVGAGEKK